MNARRVFISYSHDSTEHSARVLQLGNALRSHGVDAELDRYHVRPPKGWPNWCEEQLRPENSGFVLMVCTQTYLKRVQDKVSADEGHGVFWEGAIIYDYLYDGKGNQRFIPVLFADGDRNFIPIPVRNHTHHRLKAFDLTDAGYQELYRELTAQPLVIKPPLGEVIKLGRTLAATAQPLEPRPVKTNFPPIHLIEAKRDGRALSEGQIRDIVTAIVTGQIPDYQVSAFLMAVYFRGLGTDETRALTLAIRDSGEVLRFPADPRPVVDRHSTGGVGDKVSLALGPLLACLGLRVPMISSRGLGITGGTLDKLESIPGFTTALPTQRIIEIVQRVGCAICGQPERMVVADRRLYALRDVTGTVTSISLIVASILSKKLAQGLDALLLDVKFGAAAFMPTCDAAHELAQAIVAIGSACGLNSRALLTDMDKPLGRAVGNWLEIKEILDCLEGHGPDDLLELVLTSSAHLLVQGGKASSLEIARAQSAACLDSGAPRRKWDEMLIAQDADLDAYTRKLAQDHTASAVAFVEASRGGFVSRCDARLIGEVIRDLGGGRLSMDSVINPNVGVDRLAKPGETVEAGASLARVHAADRAGAEAAAARLQTAFDISEEAPAPVPLIAETIGSPDRGG